jgi:hypothetical protein
MGKRWVNVGLTGSIGVFEKNQCRMAVKAHGGAIKVMRLREDNTTLVTAGQSECKQIIVATVYDLYSDALRRAFSGADGHVMVWTVTANKGFNMPFA